MTSDRQFDLHEQHRLLRTMLETLHRVARRHELRYCCAYGTALGAVRHGGFIPWDTDCDVVVAGPDLEALVEALNAEVTGTDYVVHDASSDGYDHLFPRLASRRVDQNLLHVDLFPLVGTFRNPVLARFHLTAAKFARAAFLMKRADPDDRYAHTTRKKALARVARFVLMPVRASMVAALWARLARLRPFDGNGPTLNLGGSYGQREIVDERVYFPTSAGAIDGIDVDLPGQPGAYLTDMYGDYMTLPSGAQQRKELDFFCDVTLPKIQRCLHGECMHAEHRY